LEATRRPQELTAVQKDAILYGKGDSHARD
jgi:hypothetical protein